MSQIVIVVDNIRLTAELNHSETARAVLHALPLSGTANVWGDEIYFAIPLALKQAADAVDTVNVGDLGYWPTGTAFCIFFGPTPVSTDHRPRAYSPVNVFGHINEEPTVLRQVQDGAEIHITAASGKG